MAASTAVHSARFQFNEMESPFDFAMEPVCQDEWVDDWLANLDVDPQVAAAPAAYDAGVGGTVGANVPDVLWHSTQTPHSMTSQCLHSPFKQPQLNGLQFASGPSVTTGVSQTQAAASSSTFLPPVQHSFVSVDLMFLDTQNAIGSDMPTASSMSYPNYSTTDVQPFGRMGSVTMDSELRSYSCSPQKHAATPFLTSHSACSTDTAQDYMVLPRPARQMSTAQVAEALDHVLAQPNSISQTQSLTQQISGSYPNASTSVTSKQYNFTAGKQYNSTVTSKQYNLMGENPCSITMNQCKPTVMAPVAQASSHPIVPQTSQPEAPIVSKVHLPKACSSSKLQLDDEPDLSHMTVMQRYHARRKLAVQRMEREVQEKLAEIAKLEADNAKLKWHAEILENMVCDVEKQLELTASRDDVHSVDPVKQPVKQADWMEMLLSGGSSKPDVYVTGSSHGRASAEARNLDKMLAAGASLDVLTWNVSMVRERWLAFIGEVRSLLQQAELARQAVAPTAAPAQEGQTGGIDVQGVKGHDGTSGVGQSGAMPPPSTGADSAGVGTSTSHCVSTGSVSVTAAAKDPNLSSCASSKAKPQPSCAVLTSEGVPVDIQQQMDEVVFTNFTWVMAVLTRNHLLAYQFFSSDVEGSGQDLPAADDPNWVQLVSMLGLSDEQLEELSVVYQLACKCRERVMGERCDIARSMSAGLQDAVHSALSAVSNGREVQAKSLDLMSCNLRREGIVRNLVGCYAVNVLSLYQLGQLSCLCYPFFPMAWHWMDAGARWLQFKKSQEQEEQQQ
eukprot:jgi/Chrzof1/2849/Cz12g01050.t1_UROD2